MADLLPNIESNAAGPQRMQGDSGSAEQPNLKDIIKADQYQKAAALTTGLPFRTVRLRPGNNADLHRHDW